MGDVIPVAFNGTQFREGKGRIRKRDDYKLRLSPEPIIDNCDDLIMDHADPAYEAPTGDCA